ncbi:BA75_01606T0 [Komagataella pastoris]|uniref:BA75_01606T0 n=1 Tax=Komagataella pastoris TaxID=4922 RepID=A0A1B2J5N8_PICPA|nr:BA75_01606T0 [Komagataella pastoris]
MSNSPGSPRKLRKIPPPLRKLRSTTDLFNLRDYSRTKLSQQTPRSSISIEETSGLSSLSLSTLATTPTSSNDNRNILSKRRSSSIQSFSTSSSSVRSTPSHFPQRKFSSNLINESCCFCELLLSIRNTGKMSVSLSCGHYCHYDCILVLIESDLKFPNCPECACQTEPMEETISMNLVQDKLLNASTTSSFSSVLGTPAQLNDQFFFPDSAVSTATSIDFEQSKSANTLCVFPEFGDSSRGYKSLETPRDRAIDTLLSPPVLFRSTFYSKENSLFAGDYSNTLTNRNQIFRELSSPQLKIVPIIDKITINDVDPTFELDCTVSIKGPYQSSIRVLSDQDLQKKEDIQNDILNTIGSSIDEPLGTLLLFDIFQVGVDESEWSQLLIVFFEKMLITMDVKGKQVVGKVAVDTISSITSQMEDTLILNLTLLSLPELILYSKDMTLIDKWRIVLGKALKKVNQCIPPRSLSLNGWNLLQDKSLIPNRDSQDLYQQVKDQMLTNISLEVDLIICIPLITNHSKELRTLFKTLLTTLQTQNKTMNQKNRIGLVLLGKRKANFVGCIDPEWEKWDEYLSEIPFSKTKRSQPHSLCTKELKRVLHSIFTCSERDALDHQYLKEIILIDYYGEVDISLNAKISNYFLFKETQSYNPNYVNNSINQYSIVFSQSFHELQQKLLDYVSVQLSEQYSRKISFEVELPEDYVKVKEIRTTRSTSKENTLQIEIQNLQFNREVHALMKFEIELCNLKKSPHYVSIPLINHQMEEVNVQLRFSSSQIPQYHHNYCHSNQSNEILEIPLIQAPLSPKKDPLILRKLFEDSLLEQLLLGKKLPFDSDEMTAYREIHGAAIKTNGRFEMLNHLLAN